MKINPWAFKFLFVSLIFPLFCASEETSITDLSKALGRGVNFGNTLEAPTEGAWGLKLDPSYFHEIEKAGFQTVRLPIRWSAHASLTPPYEIDPLFLKRVDWAVQQALEHHLNIVINIHHYDELFKETDTHLPRFLALWQQIAEHFKDAPSSVYLEILNEPPQTTSTLWNNLFPKALKIIRESNPTRAVIIGGAQWNSYSKLHELELPANDLHLIATFHYYEPFRFTHQGASWVPNSAPWLGTPWSESAAEKKSIQDHFDLVQKWATAHRRPVWVGEFGAYSKADMESRIKWTTFVAREAEKRNFSWAYWEFGAGFGVYDPSLKKWREDLKNALIPPPENQP